MKKKKQYGRITLRVKPEIHRQIEEVAATFGLDVNGLLNLLIARSLGEAAAEACVARVFLQTGTKARVVPMMRVWQAANPQKKPKEFLDELRKYVHGDPSDLDGL